MGRAVRTITVAVLLGAATAYWAGTVFDGNGRFVLGSWSILWGGVAGLTGLGLGAGGRSGSAVLAMVMAVVAFGSWMWIALWRVPLLTLEGAWMYPLAGLATGAAVLAARSLAGQTTRRD